LMFAQPATLGDLFDLRAVADEHEAAQAFASRHRELRLSDVWGQYTGVATREAIMALADRPVHDGWQGYDPATDDRQVGPIQGNLAVGYPVEARIATWYGWLEQPRRPIRLPDIRGCR